MPILYWLPYYSIIFLALYPGDKSIFFSGCNEFPVTLQKCDFFFRVTEKRLVEFYRI
jgi:hypothetical protein